MRKWLLTGFGAGFLPVAPATWASFFVVLLWLLAVTLLRAGGASSALIATLTLVVIAAACAGCIAWGGWAMEHFASRDPRPVVLDEVAGQCVALLPAAFVSDVRLQLGLVGGAFVLFRIFDVLKPPPVRQVERLRAGLGIVADDVAAGLYSAAILVGWLAWAHWRPDAGALSDAGGMSLLQAIGLGVLQGLTEFLPVSSSGHLVLLERWMGLQSESPAMLFFDAAVHVGTLVATVAVFGRPLVKFAARLWFETRWLLAAGGSSDSASTAAGNGPARRFFALRIVGLTVIACVVTVAIALGFEGPLKSAFSSPAAVGVGWLVTAALLLATHWAARPRGGWRELGAAKAALIGVAQGMAIVPGISRSGSTICAAWLVGLRRRWAVQFSFLIAAVPILGATAKTALEAVAAAQGKIGSLPLVPILAGTVAAALVGYLALSWLVRLVRQARLWWFGPYCLVLGLGTLLAAWRGWL